MKRLPVGLCPYFPKEFDFNAPVVDRETFVEIVHLPRAAREQRKERRQVHSLNELSCWYDDSGEQDNFSDMDGEDDFSDMDEEEE
jgi:hypothetical protein